MSTRRATPRHSVQLSELPAGKDGTEHHHDRAFLSLVLGGSYRGSYGDAPRAAEAGQALYYARGVPHRGRGQARPSRVAYLGLPRSGLTAGRLHALEALARDPSLSNGPVSLELRRVFVTCIASTRVDRTRRALESFLDLLDQTADQRPRRPKWIDRALGILERDHARSPSLESVARELDLSPSNMARSFHRHVGCTPGESLRRSRLAAAAERLSESVESLAEVASSAGFSDQSHLGRLFRTTLGVTPLQYRRLFQGGP